MIEIGIGLLIIAIGSFGQSSSYVPINKIRDWSWESFWLVQGIFAWLVFPYLGAMLAVPEGSTLLELWCSGRSFGTEHRLGYMRRLWYALPGFVRWNESV